MRSAELRSYSVDAVIARVEDVIVREYAKGGTTASVKAAVDRAFDKIQREIAQYDRKKS